MSEIKIQFVLNGEEVTTATEVGETLLTLLREKLNITSLKSSCVMGECGACTVIIDGKAMNACLVMAVTADGKTIETVESLGTPEHLHPLQQAFKEIGAFQCGFCTPGFIMSAKALLDVNPNPTREEVKEALSGNICRCTGYVKPIDGVLKAAAKMQILTGEDAIVQAAERLREE